MDKLPTQSECISVMRQLETASHSDYAWNDFLQKNGVYLVVHERLVDNLFNLVLSKQASNTLEVCSGNGKLAYWLNKKGLNIKASDDCSRRDFIEELDYMDALKKYNPDMVVVCFPSEATTIPNDIIMYPSVRYLVHLGNAEIDVGWKKIRNMGSVACKNIRSLVHIYPTFYDHVATNASKSMLYEVVAKPHQKAI